MLPVPFGATAARARMLPRPLELRKPGLQRINHAWRLAGAHTQNYHIAGAENAPGMRERRLVVCAVARK